VLYDTGAADVGGGWCLVVLAGFKPVAGH